MTGCRMVRNSAWMSNFNLEATLEEAGVGVWHLDAATENVCLSPVCAEFFGLAGLEYTSFEATQKRVHPDDRGARYETIKRAIALGERYEFDYRVLKPGSGPRWLRSCGEPLADAHGGLIGLRGIVFSIDKQKRFEESLKTRRTPPVHSGYGADRGHRHQRSRRDRIVQCDGRASLWLFRRGDMRPKYLLPHARAAAKPLP